MLFSYVTELLLQFNSRFRIYIPSDPPHKFAKILRRGVSRIDDEIGVFGRYERPADRKAFPARALDEFSRGSLRRIQKDAPTLLPLGSLLRAKRRARTLAAISVTFPARNL